MTARIVHRLSSNIHITQRSLLFKSSFPISARSLKSNQRYLWSQPDATKSSEVALRTHPNTQHLNLVDRTPPLAQLPSSERASIPESVTELLPLMLTQPSHYIVIHIHGKPYLVTPGDTVRLPFKMNGVVPGDILRLNRAACIGSRDFTLKGAPYIDERIFECRATIIGTESEPMRFKEKTKRRNRKVKTVKSKHRFTILRIAELKIKTLEEIQSQFQNDSSNVEST